MKRWLHHYAQGAVSARVNSASCMMGSEERVEGILLLTSFSTEGFFSSLFKTVRPMCSRELGQPVGDYSTCPFLRRSLLIAFQRFLAVEKGWSRSSLTLMPTDLSNLTSQVTVWLVQLHTKIIYFTMHLR